MADAEAGLLPGLSAQRWAVGVFWWAWGLLVLMGAMLTALIMVFSAVWPKQALISVLVVAGVYLWVGLVTLLIPCLVKTGRENRAGYTTFPLAHQELEQRDPFTGQIVRGPGEPFLPKGTGKMLRKPPSRRDR